MPYVLREGDVETETDKRDTKKLKTHENEEIGQEKKNVTDEKIVAEYAKSGRSSCKKCSEKIESKSLRMGLSSWDSRGFENTKWHHLDCFFPVDADLVSIESIKGFADLKVGTFSVLELIVAAVVRAANEPNEHKQDLVRVRLLRNICFRESFTNTYRTRFYVRVRLLRKCTCSCLFVNFRQRTLTNINEHKLMFMNTNGNKRTQTIVHEQNI
ncbi:putative phosphoric monoester hydrolase [Helianthus anomalus]